MRRVPTPSRPPWMASVPLTRGRHTLLCRQGERCSVADGSSSQGGALVTRDEGWDSSFASHMQGIAATTQRHRGGRQSGISILDGDRTIMRLERALILARKLMEHAAAWNENHSPDEPAARIWDELDALLHELGH